MELLKLVLLMLLGRKRVVFRELLKLMGVGIMKVEIGHIRSSRAKDVIVHEGEKAREWQTALEPVKLIN